MKANEAPENLYYAPYGDIRENHPISDNDIEYTRTDAFIDKACEWLNENWTSFVNYDDEDGVVYYWNLTNKFRDYMEGK
jgi:hypothetical protein